MCKEHDQSLTGAAIRPYKPLTATFLRRHTSIHTSAVYTRRVADYQVGIFANLTQV